MALKIGPGLVATNNDCCLGYNPDVALKTGGRLVKLKLTPKIKFQPQIYVVEFEFETVFTNITYHLPSSQKTRHFF